MSAPRVTIVVPVHDAAAFLAHTLDSVVAQTSRDWFAVVVDDASSDGSRAIAQRFAGHHPGRFAVVGLDENVGVVRARNAGIAAAPATELVVLLDHDDLLDPPYLERMLAVHDAERAKGRRIGIVACDARLIGQDGTPWGQTWGERMGWEDTVDLDSLIRQNTIFARALFSREAFDAVGGFAPEVAGSDDIDLWLRIVQAGWEVAVTREALASYRISTGAMSGNRLQMNEAKLAVYRRLLARGGLTEAQRRSVRRRMRHLEGARAMNRVRNAWRDGRPVDAVRLSLVGVPRAAVAVLQDPRHWVTRRHRALDRRRVEEAAR